MLIGLPRSLKVASTRGLLLDVLCNFRKEAEVDAS